MRPKKSVPRHEDERELDSAESKAGAFYTRCDICSWQKKGDCGTYDAIPRCLRHPSKCGGRVRPVQKRGKAFLMQAKRKRVRAPDDDRDSPKTCTYCGKNYKNLATLRVHWYSCKYSPKYRLSAKNIERKNRSRKHSEVASGSKTNGGGAKASKSRCDTCRKTHQGRCGTRGAYYRCERRPADWSEEAAVEMRQNSMALRNTHVKAEQPRDAFDRGPILRKKSGGPVTARRKKGGYSAQAGQPFFHQFLACIQPVDRELAKAFWGHGVALCDATRSTPKCPWELLGAPASEIQQVLGQKDGLRIHNAAVAFSASGPDEARLLAAVRRDPVKYSLSRIIKEFSTPEPMARWIRRLYHELRVAGCADEQVWQCCGKRHAKPDVVGGGDAALQDAMQACKAYAFKSQKVLKTEDQGEYDRCRVCQDAYNLFSESHCPYTHATYTDPKDALALAGHRPPPLA